jgi:dephospho-CoA kinase
MNIIGLSGTNGAGKDTVGEYLASKGWLFVSVSQILRDELARQGLPQDRTHTRELGDTWRRESGPAVLVDKAYGLYQPRATEYKGLVISSLRNPYEADAIHALGGKLIWVDADIKTRYSRVINRQQGRAEDQKSFDQFVADEQQEMHKTEPDAIVDMSGVKAKADIFLQNDGSQTEFIKTLEGVLKNAR